MAANLDRSYTLREKQFRLQWGHFVVAVIALVVAIAIVWFAFSGGTTGSDVETTGEGDTSPALTD